MQYVRIDGTPPDPIEAFPLTEATTTQELRDWLTEHIGEDFRLAATSGDWWAFFMDTWDVSTVQAMALHRGTVLYRNKDGLVGRMSKIRFVSNFKPKDALAQ